MSRRRLALEKVAVFGATSAIARATVLRFAAEGAVLFLAARNAERLATLADEARAAGARAVTSAPMDAEQRESLDAAFDAACAALGRLDAVLIAHGDLPDQLAIESDREAVWRCLAVNGTSAVWLASRAAERLEAQGHGCLAAISSGAGERGRRSTYTYGAAKAMVTVYLQGLRARLHRHGIPVVTVLPCFVDSPMTSPLPARLRWIRPDAAAERIVAAMRRGDDVVHVPRWWRLALFVARNAPEALVKRSRSEERFADRLRRARDGRLGP